MTRTTIFLPTLVLLIAAVLSSRPALPAPGHSQEPSQERAQEHAQEQQAQALGAKGSTAVRTAMKNVDFHLTDRVVAHIAILDGRLTPQRGGIPALDDKNSFALELNSASITMTLAALSSDLNDFVFAKPDAPLKKLSASAKGNELTVKGLLASKGGIPFEASGTISATPEGMIRVHSTKVKALKLPVKGLMDLFGLDTQDLLNTKKIPGVTVDKNDLIFDPGQILPPPQMTGHLASIQIENGLILLEFSSSKNGSAGADAGKQAPPAKENCGARNYLLFKGGSVRFGKLTMADTDLELIDADPADPFDFALEHYNDQLVAGYSKSTKQGGLCVHMPDYSKVNHPAPAKKQTQHPGA
jgi:hypothetical protein